jgi:hypothetical protein
MMDGLGGDSIWQSVSRPEKRTMGITVAAVKARPRPASSLAQEPASAGLIAPHTVGTIDATPGRRTSVYWQWKFTLDEFPIAEAT